AEPAAKMTIRIGIYAGRTPAALNMINRRIAPMSSSPSGRMIRPSRFFWRKASIVMPPNSPPMMKKLAIAAGVSPPRACQNAWSPQVTSPCEHPGKLPEEDGMVETTFAELTDELNERQQYCAPVGPCSFSQKPR